MTNVDFESGVVTLFNFGETDEPLSGWRLCTADDNQTFRYTSSIGLSGFTIESGTAFMIHYNDDAPGGDDSVNVSALGGFIATPLTSGAYGWSIYKSGSFSNPAEMVDYVQWTDDPDPLAIGNLSADARAGTAVTAGLWTATDAWVLTDGGASQLDFVGDPANVLHGPADYEPVTGGDCPDFDNNGDVGFSDLTMLLGVWGPCPGCPEDLDGNGDVGFSDLTILLGRWGRCEGS